MHCREIPIRTAAFNAPHMHDDEIPMHATKLKPSRKQAAYTRFINGMGTDETNEMVEPC